MTKLLAAGVLALILSGAAVADETVPAELNPPEGNELFLKAEAEGTQNYICLSSGSAMKWTFLAPQATLFVPVKLGSYEIRLQVATHYLSPNSAENGTPRATWQGSSDTSATWGRAIATVPGDTGAIPWLLLQVVGSRPGFFGQTTFIQRRNTVGGVAPAEGCAAAEDLGRTAFVPYTTDYYFYRATAKSQ